MCSRACCESLLGAGSKLFAVQGLTTMQAITNIRDMKTTTIQFKGHTVYCFRDATRACGWDFWSKSAALLTSSQSDIDEMARLAEQA